VPIFPSRHDRHDGLEISIRQQRRYIYQRDQG
jgi:hypothetical protein